jgi:pyruvate dehydrogenase E1 component beta subunit
MVAEYGMYDLSAPIKRVAVPDTPIPFAPIMEKAAIPNERRIVETVKAVLG